MKMFRSVVILIFVRVRTACEFQLIALRPLFDPSKIDQRSQ